MFVKNRFEIGQAFETEIVAITDNTIFLDLSAKSEGVLDKAELADENGEVSVKEGDKIIGNQINVKIVKNKVAPPFKSCKVDLIYGKGLSKASEVLELALQYGLAKKSGSWFEVLGERVGQGKDNTLKFLNDNPDVYEELVSKVLEEQAK